MVMSWINLLIDSFQFVPKKCGNQSAFCELYVSQSEEGSRLGDDLGCASSGWWARARCWQPLTRQAALNFTTADCSANGSVPVISRWAAMRVSTVYICKSFSIVSSQWARQRRWHRKGSDLMREEISRQDDLLRSCKLDRIALLRMFKAG